MEEWLKSILLRIADGSLLPPAYYIDLDCDAALDARDGDEQFDGSWVRLSKEIERHWENASVAEELRSLADAIRRESFLAVSRATQQHEIAGYVSDDFDLIVRAKLVGLADPLLEKLWSAYERGSFPRPPL